MQTMGLLFILVFLAIAVAAAKAVATRFDPQPFCALCATIYMCGLVVALIVAPPAGAGNEFGSLGEIILFYPVGLAFWVAGLVALSRAMYYGEPLGRVRVTLQCISGVMYIGPLVFVLLS
jgi:hypothetical protein